jgi:hypothetical protein
MEKRTSITTPKPHFQYANELENVTFREYGRNIQGMARHLLTIEDRERRNRMAITLVELMKQLNPVVGEPNDYYQKLWDHLYVMTEMKLDVDGPFPKPDNEILVKKPMQVPYRKGDARFKHYGRSLELMVEQAMALPTEEERENASIYLCRLMKTFVLTHSKDLVEDNVVIENLKKLSNGKLVLDPEKVAANNLLSINPKEILQSTLQGGSRQNNGGGQRNRNQRHHQHKRRR